MTTNLLQDYQKHAENVQAILRNDTNWITQYRQYAEKMIEHTDDYKKLRKTFRKQTNLDFYLTIGNIIDFKKFFDIRYLGQSIGKLSIKNNEPSLNVEPKINKKSGDFFFGYNLGNIADAPWRERNGKAQDFRNFYKNHAIGAPRQKEHMVESALFAELEKTSSQNKTLCGIQPVKFANTRIHMKTALKASNDKDIRNSNQGGEIDIFCRRKVGKESQLTVIEVKDENTTVESFNLAMKQALAYAVFIRELWRSEAGKAWCKIWGLSEYLKNRANTNGLTINAVVAMPEGETQPDYNGECITFKCANGVEDKIALHYIAIKSDINEHNATDVQFNTSL